MFFDLSLFDLVLIIAVVPLPLIGLVSSALLLIFDRRKMKQEQEAGQHQQWFALFMFVLLLYGVIGSLGLAHHPLPSFVVRFLLVASLLALFLPVFFSREKDSKQ